MINSFGQKILYNLNLLVKSNIFLKYVQILDNWAIQCNFPFKENMKKYNAAKEKKIKNDYRFQGNT